MLKKIIIGLVVFIVLAFGTLLAAPFLFKDKIQNFVLRSINNNLNATVDFSDVGLSLIRNFPQATVQIKHLSVVNEAPFLGDTLFYGENISLKMSIKELFKNENESINLQSFSLENSLVNILFNEEGLGNYDIALKKEEEEETEKTDGFVFSIKNYEVKNMRFVYDNRESDMKLTLANINHTGTGDFSAKQLDLNTHSTADFGFAMGKSQLFTQVPLVLDAVLSLDLENQKYTFKENKALIRQMALAFNGFIQLQDNGQLYDLTFETPNNSFQNFLAMMPSAYTGGLNDVITSGNFSVAGKVKGTLTDDNIPTFQVNINSDNASFKFPELPNKVDQISINTNIANESGLAKDTYVDIKNLSFRIGQDVFSGNALISNLTDNANVKAEAKGTINLANLSKAYPVALDQPLKGILKANLNTAFDMKTIEAEQYQNIKNSGTLSLSDFEYALDAKKTMTVSEAVLLFDPAVIKLQNFETTLGKSDLKANGKIDNLYGYLFNDKNLKGSFNLESNQFEVADFMMTEEAPANSNEKTVKEAIKIPAFLDCTVNAKANTVVYDNLNLKNVIGQLVIKDETVYLKDVITDIFGGQIAFNGDVSTKTDVPSFHMDLGIKSLDVFQSFSQLDMLKKILPIANVIDGKFDSNIKLEGLLDANELTANLNSLSGNLMGLLMGATINTQKSNLLSSLSSNFNFIDFKKIDLNNLRAVLSFDKGKVNVNPINLKYQDIDLVVGGTHGFDQTINYNINLNVPAKYLGNEVNNLINRLTPNQQNQLSSIPIVANVGGNFSKPTVTTDLKQVTTSLVKNIAEQQKNALIGKGSDALSNLIDKNRKPGDTTRTVIPTSKEEINQKIDEEKERLEQKAREERERLEQKAREEANKKANSLLDRVRNRNGGN